MKKQLFLGTVLVLMLLFLLTGCDETMENSIREIPDFHYVVIKDKVKYSEFNSVGYYVTKIPSESEKYELEVELDNGYKKLVDVNEETYLKFSVGDVVKVKLVKTTSTYAEYQDDNMLLSIWLLYKDNVENIEKNTDEINAKDADLSMILIDKGISSEFDAVTHFITGIASDDIEYILEAQMENGEKYLIEVNEKGYLKYNIGDTICFYKNERVSKMKGHDYYEDSDESVSFFKY